MNDCPEQKNISILSWNVHDIMDQTLGSKTSLDDFCDILKKGMIFCLQETKAEVQLPQYLCFNQLRPKSRSGGLCIGVHRSISQKVKKIKSEYDDILAVLIPTAVTGLNKDVVLINVYDSPSNSSYKIRQIATGSDIDTIDHLLNFVAQLDNKAVMLAGDFN